MNIIITLILYHMIILHMRSRNNEIDNEIELMRAVDQKPECHLEWPNSSLVLWFSGTPVYKILVLTVLWFSGSLVLWYSNVYLQSVTTS